MSDLNIEITQEDIDNGVPSCQYCPIALALNREYPKTKIFVGVVTAQIDGTIYYHSREARLFIHEFYINPKEVVPQSVTLFAKPLDMVQFP